LTIIASCALVVGMSDQPNSSVGLEEAIASVQNAANLARKLGVTPQLVSRWRKRQTVITAERAVEIETATGVKRHKIRPDLWPSESAA
jgi:DNA-binding transcriptional regulator YdaS (Cro superfamily)